MSFFPTQRIEHAGDYARAYFDRLNDAYATVSTDAMTAAGRLLSDAAQAGRTIYSCGNGGSAAIANHLVCDCLKGVRTNSNLKPKVVSLSSTVELITAIVNDIGSEQMFSFQLESLGSEGDVLVAISSSGSSPNIINAVKTAKSLGMRTLSMTGFSGGETAKLADVSLHVDAQNYGVIEDAHQSLMHILAQYMRQLHISNVEQLGKLKF
ncbi:D-sedoheptulose-7-phosphate isomerase [Brevundimonas vesicularis]|uniref:SIS domain-containing protein n=1 Tax=Brevundimonas vesicularis TaxID=41276 RepID=A0A1Z3U809_BREVE|nr:SIS domain-containing protein [Brevundimonas vesicularis]ASE39409.1 SIS domain-containing protein [Brevundimonas vesicularis]MDX2335366.1 SIS domain-containing protein [Brevundimonas vesicularis]